MLILRSFPRKKFVLLWLADLALGICHPNIHDFCDRMRRWSECVRLWGCQDIPGFRTISSYERRAALDSLARGWGIVPRVRSSSRVQTTQRPSVLGQIMLSFLLTFCSIFPPFIHCYQLHKPCPLLLFVFLFFFLTS